MALHVACRLGHAALHLSGIMFNWHSNDNINGDRKRAPETCPMRDQYQPPLPLSGLVPTRFASIGLKLLFLSTWRRAGQAWRTKPKESERCNGNTDSRSLTQQISTG